MLTIVPATGTLTHVTIEPAMRAIVSWNGAAPTDTLELIVHRADGRSSLPLPYASFDDAHRASLDGFDDVAKIATDVVSATRPIVGIDVGSTHPLERVAISTPPSREDRTAGHGFARAVTLDVPEISQYVAAFPDKRSWCTPASLAMLLGTWGLMRDVPRIATAIQDDAYGGTGNWAFAVAYAGRLGFVGAAAYLRAMRSLEGFVRTGIPVAASISWEAGELPGAPLATSDGHIVVVRGFDEVGDPVVNDPAQPEIRHVYPRAAFEACWLDHGGVALLVAPAGRVDDVVRCANS